MRAFRFDPRNDEIITKAIPYAKKVVLNYYDEKEFGKPTETINLTQKKKAKIHRELNDTLEFVLIRATLILPSLTTD